MWEYQDYAIDVGHIEAVYEFLVSEKTWQENLNESQQNALEEAVQDTVDYLADIVDEENKEFVKTIEEEGMEIIEVDKEEFRQAAMPATDEIVETMLAPGLEEDIEEANQD
ncbi:hypothetical protein [Alteribacillus bidgolensis]|uniref:Extracellular solute-binding protein, family 7 n=1 Tax=Alteribacillus bidgolensis TaxID=930129 RepID=A0A1G8I8T8_9BACI|nr:hypothetical protein [Alteribacillus bidgolensis]SDI15262.1 extracellular solute-binding protein, family 7 [Alteribacillus bidgolensis]